MIKNKRFIFGILVLVLCMSIGFGLGWVCKEPEIVEINITRPNVSVFEPVEEIEKTPTYTEMQVVATAYCPCEKCCGKSDGITSTGVKAKANHTIAADPKILPYGTEIRCGYGEFVVEDTGGALKGKNRIDFFFDTHEEALQFGRQNITIWVKEDVK